MMMEAAARWARRQGRRKMLFLAAGLFGALCVGVPLAAFAGYNLFYFVGEQLAPAASPTSLPTPVPSVTAAPTKAPVCGGPPAMFILLVGSDSRADNYSAGLADSIRIVRVDFVDPGISHLVFQRDLYVEIPGIAAHGGITHGKLNQAYFYGNPALNYSEGPGDGPGLLARTLDHNFGARVDHYVAVNLQAFARIVDQVGGLDIDLPYTVDGRTGRSTDQDKYFPAGHQHLNGYRAMLLARLRPNGDFERSQTQNLILQALAAKLLLPAMRQQLPELVSTLYGLVQTDLGAEEVTSLICLGAYIDADDILGLSFPDNLFAGSTIHDPVLGNTFVWSVEFDELREYVIQFNDGSWPGSGPTPTEEPVP